MEVIKKTKTYEVDRFVAFDGKEFDSQWACKRHENDLLFPAAEEAFEKLVTFHIEEAFHEDVNIYVVALNSADDYETVKAYCQLCGTDTDYLDAPKSCPCKYALRMDDGGYFVEEINMLAFAKWARDLVEAFAE